jgi:hypothetical protein
MEMAGEKLRRIGQSTETSLADSEGTYLPLLNMNGVPFVPPYLHGATEFFGVT